MLTDTQKLSFKQNGFVVVEDAIDEELVDHLREAVWDAVDVDRDDVSLLEAENRVSFWDEALDEEPFDELNRQAHEYATELVGDSLAEPGDRTQLALRFPNGEVSDGDRPSDHGGHVDGYGPGFNSDGEVRSFTVASAVYLEDVLPRGGGFTVWPGSHWRAAEYFSTHALETLGHAHGSHVPADLDDHFEISGDAGTLVLWHNKLTHTGGVNRSPNVRMSAITRFSREDIDEIRRDAADKPFKYWDGLTDVVPESPPNPYADDEEAESETDDE
ncbi:MAG: phytanoyl-CoA dioxygenase family protein [Halobacteriaceae archaeon]